MIQKFKRLPLENQVFVSFALASTLLLSITLCLLLFFDIRRQQTDLDTSISSTASYIASLESVVDMLERGYPDNDVSIALNLLHQSFPNLDTIAIYNQNRLRFYHTDRHETGETFVNGEEIPILEGAQPYITTGYGTYGTQHKAFHAVTKEDGTILGFVTVAVFSAAIQQENLSLMFLFFLILCVALLIAFALSHGIVSLLKKSLHGYHPTQLLNLYLQQDNVLNAVEDGLIATDSSGHILFANDTACQIFSSSDTELRGKPFPQVFPETNCLQVAQTGNPVHNRSSIIRDHQVLTSEVPIQSPDGIQGVLNIFHDKTEMRKLSDELSGTRYMLDTLRFFNHEFMNKLHIILGYLQTGQTQQAAQFIMNTSLVSGQSIRETADCIRVSRLCALIIGKMMHASESSILLSVSQDSYCREEDLLLPVEDCATIIGNLLENAIEALSSSQSEIKEIKLSLYCRPDCNIIVCEDTGDGIPAHLIPHIWEKGTSSKGTGRGVGLYLIRQLVEEHDGTIDLETEPGEGTLFTLTFTQKKEAL